MKKKEFGSNTAFLLFEEKLTCPERRKRHRERYSNQECRHAASQFFGGINLNYLYSIVLSADPFHSVAISYSYLFLHPIFNKFVWIRKKSKFE